jgi:hypothetical protein
VKVLRVLLLGAVAVGIVLVFTSAPSSGGPLGQATGYGPNVVHPCPAGEDVGPTGEPCLKDEVVQAETASEQAGDGGGGGLSTEEKLALGVAGAGVASGAAYAVAKKF